MNSLILLSSRVTRLAVMGHRIVSNQYTTSAAAAGPGWVGGWQPAGTPGGGETINSVTATDTRAGKFESLERISSVRETDGKF